MIHEIFRFLVVGVLSNITNFFVYLSLYFLGVGLFLASLLGYTVGIYISYNFGRKWVFGKIFDSSKKLLISFYLVYIVGGIIMSVIIVISTNILEIDYRISWIIGAFFAVTNNFVGQKFIVFRKIGDINEK